MARSSKEKRQSSLRIKGMHCATCTEAVRESLMSVEGVEKVTVNLATEKASFVYDPKLASMENMEQAVNKAGYEVAKDETSLTVGGMHCATCALTIQDALREVPGVSDAKVNFALGKAVVQFDSGLSSSDVLKKAVEKAGYKVLEVEGVMAEQIARKEELREGYTALLIAATFAIPVAIISMTYDLWPEGVLAMDVRNYILLILAAPVQFYAGLRYYRGAYRAFVNRRANMDTLVVLGTTAAYVYSAAVTFLPEVVGSMEVYFDSSAVIITLVLAGKYLELRSRGATSQAIVKLMDLQPPKAVVIRDGNEVEIPVEELAEGDIVVVKPGERVPADGEVVSGKSAVDESLVTGESIPQEKGPGSAVTGGTVNIAGVLRVRATRVGRNTTLAQIVRLVEDAQATKAPIERLADTIAGYFVPVVLTIALATFLFWYFIGSNLWDVGETFTFALTAFVAVLVIACPCALGLATPTAIVVGTGRGAQLGILIKNAETLEIAHKLTTVVFDKTGTLTVGHPRVVRTELGSARDERELLLLAGSVEKGSEHVLSKAIIESAEGLGIVLKTPGSSTVVPGEGVSAEVNGKVVIVGNRRMAERHGVRLGSLEPKMEEMENAGMTAVVCASEGEVLGLLGVADTLKKDAGTAVQELRALGLKVVMITGDNDRTAKAIAEQAGIPDYRAQVLPADKAGAVKAFQESGEVVAMVGDGINDAPALAQADIGIAIGGGTDIALESGNIVLMGNDLRGVSNAIKLSRRTFRKIRQNLFWALFYNTAAIPVAAGLLFPITNWLLSPMIAAAAMAFSSVSVVSNAALLKRFRP